VRLPGDVFAELEQELAVVLLKLVGLPARTTSIPKIGFDLQWREHHDAARPRQPLWKERPASRCRL